MFPDWTQARQQLLAKLDELASHAAFRIFVAALLASMHLATFARAGEQRLGLPFNSAPGEAPYFSDPDAKATTGFPRQPHRWSRLVVSRFDAQHYIGTSIRNFTACPTDGSTPDIEYLHCGLGWLPAFGLAGGVVSQVTGIADDIALMLLSLFCAIAVNLMWTCKTIVNRIGKLEAYATLIAFNFYPSAFYMVTPYTEAATIALLLGGFIALAKERWLLSAFLIGASTALRISSAALGAGLGCALLVAAYQRHKAGTPQWWRPLIAIPLCGWGQFATMALLKVEVGSFWAFFRARESFGDEHDWSRVVDGTYYVRGFAAQNMDSVVLVAVIAIIALTGRYVIRRFTGPEATYLIVGGVLTLILVLVAPLQYWGITRYIMLAPLGYLAMGAMARRHTAVFVLWLVLCALFYWHVELCGYISQGNPKICPCLGRFELWMPFES